MKNDLTHSDELLLQFNTERMFLAEEEEEEARNVVLLQDITERKKTEEKIKDQLDELKRWQAVMLGREDRVQELKREVNDLCGRLGERVRYESQKKEERKNEN